MDSLELQDIREENLTGTPFPTMENLGCIRRLTGGDCLREISPSDSAAKSPSNG